MRSPLEPAKKLGDALLLLAAAAFAAGDAAAQGVEARPFAAGQHVVEARGERAELSEAVGEGLLVAAQSSGDQAAAADGCVPSQKEVAQGVAPRRSVAPPRRVPSKEMGDVGAEQAPKKPGAEEFEEGVNWLRLDHWFGGTLAVIVCGSLGGIVGGALYYLMSGGQSPFDTTRRTGK